MPLKLDTCAPFVFTGIHKQICCLCETPQRLLRRTGHLHQFNGIVRVRNLSGELVFGLDWKCGLLINK